MKFFKAAIAAVAALASFSEAKNPSAHDKKAWKDTLNHRMKNNMYNTDVLMRGAKPYNDAAKKREAGRFLENNNNNQFQITSQHSIQFLSCFSLATGYDELFENNDQNNGNALMMWKNGQLLAERSYAIFRLCYNQNCAYSEGDPSLEYVIDLQTYVQALVMYLPDQVDGFCQGCQENEDACTAQLYGYGGQYGAQYGGGYNNQNAAQGRYGYQYGNGYQMANNDDGGRRKLSDVLNSEKRRTEEGQVVRQLDCGLCVQYGCIGNNNNNNNNNGFDAAAEWLLEIAQCYQTGAVYGGYYQQQGGQEGNLFAGFICNDEGNGVEIGMFLDEECVLYLPNESYQNYMSYFDSAYQEMTADIIEFTFSQAYFGCKDEEVVYTTNNMNGYQQYYGNYNNNNNNEPAEWCAYLYENELGATPSRMYDCDGYGYNQYAQYAGNYNQNNNQYGYAYDWYSYEISEEDSIDMQAVCKVVKKQDGNMHTFYNPNMGHLYSYGSSSSGSEQIEEFLDGSENSSVSNYKKQKSAAKKVADLSGAAIFGIVAAVGVVVGAMVAVALKMRASSTEKKEPLMAGQLEEQPEEEGTMA